MIQPSAAVLAFVAAVAVVGPAASQDVQRPELLDRLIQCRGLADGTARLACFDSAAAALDQAERQGEVVVVDRAQVRESQRRLFGFNVGGLLPVFGRADAIEPELDTMEGVLASARQGGEGGRWIFTLEDGSVWRQVDSEQMNVRPRAGHSIRIRRAALGSFLASVNDTRSVRVARDR